MMRAKAVMGMIFARLGPVCHFGMMSAANSDRSAMYPSISGV